MMNSIQIRQMAARLQKEVDRLTAAADKLEGKGKPRGKLVITETKSKRPTMRLPKSGKDGRGM